MTQRVARPMKFAAFISIILSVAVLFAACQGAVGPAGKDGKDGTDGQDGGPGPQGSPAFQSLELKAKMPSVVISDAENADGDTIPGAAQTIDLAEYIRGTAERMYGTPTNSQTTAAEQIFKATLEGSMLTITPTDPQPTSAPYVVETFSIMISDGGESNPVTLEVPARRNRAPAGSDTDATATVGTQVPDKAPDDVRVCTAADGAGANQCYVDVTFTDADHAGDVMEDLSFTATSSDTSKVEVVEVETAPADPANPLVARLVVKGIASTWDSAANAGAGAHDPVEVVVVATDAGGETARGKAQISVDGQPTAQTIPGPTNPLVQGAANVSTYVIDVAGYFKDPEGATLEFPAATAVKSSDTNVATVAISGTTVTVTRNAPGTTTITVTASEPTGTGADQSVSASFEVKSN